MDTPTMWGSKPVRVVYGEDPSAILSEHDVEMDAHKRCTAANEAAELLGLSKRYSVISKP
jgi:hypothetical protein